MTCSICLDKITDLHETNCGHQFCKSCFQEYQKYQQNCPVCRSYFEDSNIYFTNREPVHFKPQDKLTNNHIFSMTLYKPEILAWVDKKSFYSPLYLIKTSKNKDICISSYLRHIMIYHHLEEKDIKLYVSNNKVSFYCTDQRFNYNFNKQIYSIMEGWIFEVVELLKVWFSFDNFCYFNIMISDIVMNYIHKNKITTKSMYQVIICSSIFVAMEIYVKTYSKYPRNGEFFKEVKAKIFDLGSKAKYISHFEKIIREIKQERYMFEDFLTSAEETD